MANRLDAPSESAAAVVEKLGFGQAQVRNLFLGHGIWLVEAMQVSLSAVFTVCLASQLGWSNAQRASLSSLLFVGITFGSLCGGYLGDIIGRKPPILACYALAALAHFLHICSSMFWVIALLRLCVGFAHGLGMPTSIALVSETAPVSWRAFLQGCRNIIFSMGSITACVVLIVDDPSLKNLHWRTDVIIASVPPAIFFVFAWALLYESPLILSHLRRREEALKSLEATRRLNGWDDFNVDVSYTPPVGEEAVEKDSLKQLKIVFSTKMLCNTIALSFASLVTNIVLYGHIYAFPLITTQLASKSSVNAMQPGYQSLMQALIGMVTVVIIVPLGSAVSRRNMICIGSAIGILGMILFALTAGIQDRTYFQRVCYYFAQNAPSPTGGCIFLGVYQLSVDLYPVQAASTSAAVVLFCGRIGAIVGPFIFEAFPHWEYFYTFLAILCAISLILTMTLLGVPTPAAADKKALIEKGEDLESM
eukprot:CAMPEP_0180612018 /NCGR_PEP_ID=MMETSP1037_2-20121125/30139_1 /TAXON_ID=632150 /ORGANISM="Azadinium spinosum, Strain 3D9" /LENGTH=477 /DNA_ID=CAMNT_0022631595 /DNA_START=69 /DNA_END=1499 /DNA_ORIENTATION=-